MPIRRQLRTAGITLVELLVVLAIGGVILSGAITMMLTHIRTSSRLTALLRLQDQCGRVQFLINHEIQQAEQARTEGSALVLDVPGMPAPIRYEVISGELIRNGPPINAQGRLVDSSASDALVVRGVVDFDVDTSNARQPTYRISVQDSNGVIYKTASPDGAQCRVRSITEGV